MYVRNRTWLESGPRGLGLPYWMLEGGFMPIEAVARANNAAPPSEALIQKTQAQRMAQITGGRVQNYRGAALREDAYAAKVREGQLGRGPVVPAIPTRRPAPATTRAIAVPRLMVKAKGVGVYLDAAYCKSFWSLLDPYATLMGGCAVQDVANVAQSAGTAAGDLYNKVQYGPTPGVVAPPAPTVKLVDASTAAATPGAVYAGTDSSGSAVYAVPQTAAESQAAIVQKQNAAIDAAAAAGWNPAGNLPVNALDLSDFFTKYGSYLLLGAAALAGVAVLGVVKAK